MASTVVPPNVLNLALSDMLAELSLRLHVIETLTSYNPPPPPKQHAARIGAAKGKWGKARADCERETSDVLNKAAFNKGLEATFTPYASDVMTPEYATASNPSNPTSPSVDLALSSLEPTVQSDILSFLQSLKARVVSELGPDTPAVLACTEYFNNPPGEDYGGPQATVNNTCALASMLDPLLAMARREVGRSACATALGEVLRAGGDAAPALVRCKPAAPRPVAPEPSAPPFPFDLTRRPLLPPRPVDYVRLSKSAVLKAMSVHAPGGRSFMLTLVQDLKRLSRSERQLEKVSVGEEERAERQEEWKDALKRLRWAWETCGMGKMRFLHREPGRRRAGEG